MLSIRRNKRPTLPLSRSSNQMNIEFRLKRNLPDRQIRDRKGTTKFFRRCSPRFSARGNGNKRVASRGVEKRDEEPSISVGVDRSLELAVLKSTDASRVASFGREARPQPAARFLLSQVRQSAFMPRPVEIARSTRWIVPRERTTRTPSRHSTATSGYWVMNPRKETEKGERN